MDREKEHLFNINPHEIIEYIKNSIEILLNMKDDDYNEIQQEMVKMKQREKGNLRQLRALKKEKLNLQSQIDD